MENLTHSLIGAALAEVALPANAAPRQRTAFFAAGILAANLPDADLLYTSITPPPLGYLLHHRGHTHTVLGLVGLAVLIAGIAALPWVERTVGHARRRFWILVAAALLSHLVADAWNSYGVHPFWPVNNAWLYGDSIFIVEPWFWTLLGTAVVLNAHSTMIRVTLGVVLLAIPGVAAAAGMVERGPIVAVMLAAIPFAVFLHRLTPRHRAWIGLGCAASFVAIAFALRPVARRHIPAGGEVVDVILSPRPANPLCWNALVVEKSGDDLVMRRGSVAIVRGMCPGLSWSSPVRQSIGALRDLAGRNCSVRAWLQFGRAPAIANGEIYDARFGQANFTSMRIDTTNAARECPPHLTAWQLPRADVLGDLR